MYERYPSFLSILEMSNKSSLLSYALNRVSWKKKKKTTKGPFYVLNSRAFYKATIYLLLALFKLMKLDLLHVQ